jgi:ribonuclease Z
MVVFHDARYLFDAGENVTRAMVQDRISMKKLRSIFLSSSVQVQSTSGLGGELSFRFATERV